MGKPLTDIIRQYSKAAPVIHRTVPFCQRQLRPVVPVSHNTSSIFGSHVEPSKPERFIVKVPRPKIKTRGEPRAIIAPDGNAEEGPAAIDQDAAGPDATTKFKLTPRALDVFRGLFSTNDSDGRRGEMDWKDFCNAMTKVGFTAQNLYGSVWYFKSATFRAD